MLDNDCKKLKDFLNKISRNNCHKETTNTLPPSRTLLFLIAAELFDAEKNYRQNLPAAEVNIANAIIRLLEVANFLEIEIDIDITGTYSRSITLGYENPYDMFFCLIPCIFDLEAFINHIKRRRKKSTLNKLRNVGPAFGGIIYKLFKLGQVLNLDVKTAILEISNLPHSSK